MKKCSICNKNVAVIYTTKLEADKKTTIGICMSCAKELNIPVIDEILGKLQMPSISDFDLENLSEQIQEITENMNPEDMMNIAHTFFGDNEALNNIDFSRLDVVDIDDEFGESDLDTSDDDNEYDDDEDDKCDGCGVHMDSENDDSEEKNDDKSTDEIARLNRRRSDKTKNDNSSNKSTISSEAINGITEAFEKMMSMASKNKTVEPINSSGSEDDTRKSSSSITTKENATKRKSRKHLEKFGTYLPDKIASGEIDKVIGRDVEIQRVMNILSRRTKNNPVLVGEPGVGKTAIAEGLALRIHEGRVPDKLVDCEIYELDITSVVAGTSLRGQFEARMVEIIKEAKSSKNIILVIDEIHKLIGAGDTHNGGMDAANILKPALSRGEVQIIGTTTLEEYRKHIERDSALERRLQPVYVDEPTVADSIEIVKGIKHYYEDFHGVEISDEVVKQAVTLSERYVNDRFLPDKAIDVLDEACAMVNLRNNGSVNIKALKKKLKEVIELKEQASLNDDFEKAANYKTQEINLNLQIQEMSSLENHDNVLSINDIGTVIENWTKIPVTKITEEEAKKLISLEQTLHSKIIGQDEAVAGVAKAIRRNRAGFRQNKKPASFIFVGPTGVGKTELAKRLAEVMFGSQENMIRLDMSEYMEQHTVSKMIGAPPGYVGYDQGGQLTTLIKQKPYSVILMDEIEKAHPDVFNMLLQILEDGRLTDSQGKTVHFENSIIIMTSNAGSHARVGAIGFSKDRNAQHAEKLKSALKEHFRPEFLNRVDEIIAFDHLTKEQVRQIVDLQLEDIYKEASEKNIEINITDDVKDYLAEKGYDETYGARPLKREIQRLIEDEMAEKFLKGEIAKQSQLFITLAPDAMSLMFDVKHN